jgi:hypothetical protein
MQNSVTVSAIQQGNTATVKPPKFKKRIGSTVYDVSVRFSTTSNETIEDKILHLVESEVKKTA